MASTHARRVWWWLSDEEATSCPSTAGVGEAPTSVCSAPHEPLATTLIVLYLPRVVVRCTLGWLRTHRGCRLCPLAVRGLSKSHEEGFARPHEGYHRTGGLRTYS